MAFSLLCSNPDPLSLLHLKRIRPGADLDHIIRSLFSGFHSLTAFGDLGILSGREIHFRAGIGRDGNSQRERSGRRSVPIGDNFPVHRFVFAARLGNARVEVRMDHDLVKSRTG